MCLKFLFEGWVLDSSSKFAWAFVLTVAAAAASELLAKLRRDTSRSAASGAVRLALMVGHNAVAYSLMLVVMTFRGELVVATLAGLGAGHAVGKATARTAQHRDYAKEAFRTPPNVTRTPRAAVRENSARGKEPTGTHTPASSVEKRRGGHASHATSREQWTKHPTE